MSRNLLSKVFERTAQALTLVVSLGLPMQALADHDEPKELPEIQTITTEDESIQAACPQLQNVQLLTRNLSTLPFLDLKKEHKLSVLGSIKASRNDTLSRKERKEFQNFQTRLLSASSVNSFAITINSTGGNINRSQELIDAILDSPARVTAYAPHDIASAATTLLVAADERFLTHDSVITVHNISYAKESGNKYASDYPPDSEEWKDLEEDNEYNRNLYKDKSQTNISKGCANSLFKDRVDVEISAEDMLKLGLADYIINWKEKEIQSIDFDSVPLPAPVPKPPLSLPLQTVRYPA